MDLLTSLQNYVRNCKDSEVEDVEKQEYFKILMVCTTPQATYDALMAFGHEPSWILEFIIKEQEKENVTTN
jgi:hypothetical protein